MNTIARRSLWILPLLLPAASLAQIAQNHPELCGAPSQFVPIPQGVSAHLEDAGIVVNVARTAALPPIKLPWVEALEIREVCSVGANKVVVFGWIGVYEIAIISLDTGAILDSFIAYDPVMSPDRRWLLMRRFYPVHTEFVISEEYLLYDLTADATTNRRGPAALKDFLDAPRWTVALSSPGWVIYHSLVNNVQIEPGDVPETDVHQFSSDSFFWDPGSHYVVFADTQHKTFSIVLSRIENGKITIWKHPIPYSELCSPSPYWHLRQATVSLVDPTTPVVTVRLRSDDSGTSCSQEPLTLTMSDFMLAELESYTPPKRKPAVGVRRPVPEEKQQ